MILKIKSRAHEAQDPGVIFEWHQAARKVYAIRPHKNGALADGILIAEGINSQREAGMVVASYAQGFAHCLRYRQDAVGGISVPGKRLASGQSN